jgi:hypothetical protein
LISQYFYPSHASTSQLVTDLASGLADRNYDVKVLLVLLPIPKNLVNFKLCDRLIRTSLANIFYTNLLILFPQAEPKKHLSPHTLKLYD